MGFRLRVAAMVALSALISGFVAGSAPAAPAQGGPPYEQPVYHRWDRAEMDVLIVPPNHGQIYNEEGGVLAGNDPAELTPTNSYLPAIERSIAAYPEAVKRFGPRWLAKGLKIRSYVLGRDQVPPEALKEPEIIVFTDESKGPVLGIAINTKDFVGRHMPCLVNASKLATSSFTYADMYNTMGQEFGHCLGLDHVIGGNPNDPVLALDLLNGTYPHKPGAKGNPLHCLSNLNVLGLQIAFAAAFEKSMPQRSVLMQPRRYRTMDCSHAP